jgi:hypothetical protein
MRAGDRAYPRAGGGIAPFSGGVGMVPLRLCDIAAWHAKPRLGRPGRVLFRGGIGRKR